MLSTRNKGMQFQYVRAEVMRIVKKGNLYTKHGRTIFHVAIAKMNVINPSHLCLLLKTFHFPTSSNLDLSMALIHHTIISYVRLFCFVLAQVNQQKNDKPMPPEQLISQSK